MSRWETTASLATEAAPAAVWEKAYVDASAWPLWNRELKRATLDGPLAAGAEARIVFRTGLRLRFRVTEFEDGRLFTDEARLPGARMGHRHLVEPAATDGEDPTARSGPASGSRLTNTIYIEGPLAGLWRRVLGPAAARSLPGAQRAIAGLAVTGTP